MRINQFVAKATGLGRRKADKLVLTNLITVNDKPANLGQDITDEDIVKYAGRVIEIPHGYTRILLNKPVGYVCSRDGQGSKTIYDLLPNQYSKLKSIGRLDKDTSGLILLTDDGQLAQELSHPSFNKQKIYEVKLPRDLTNDQIDKLQNGSIRIDQKPSILKIKKISSAKYQVTLTEGRNRQIRRSFEKINIAVVKLNRIQFGPYKLSDLKNQTWAVIE
jgi:pseudouridine synthase